MEMSFTKANEELIVNEIQNISQRVSLLPTTDQVKVIVSEGIQGHEDRCGPRNHFGTLADRTAEMTGEFKVLKDTGNLRRSLVPKTVQKLPPWAQVLLGIAGAVGTAIGGLAASGRL